MLVVTNGDFAHMKILNYTDTSYHMHTGKYFFR